MGERNLSEEEIVELTLFKMMYAKLTGQVDDILQELAEVLSQPDCGRAELEAFGEKVKQALLDAEEAYVSAGIEESDI